MTAFLLWFCLQDNTIDFLEFVAALNLVFRGDLEHKLRWSFKVYDRDNNGYVDRSELRSIIEVSSGDASEKRWMNWKKENS